MDFVFIMGSKWRSEAVSGTVVHILDFALATVRLGPVSNVLVGILSALVATNQAGAVSNLITQATGLSVAVPAPNDAVSGELQSIMKEDDAAQAEVDGWIRENEGFAAKGAGLPAKEMRERILRRFESTRKAYSEFVLRHPGDAKARVAYASFLHDIGDEDGEVAQLEKARELDPKNPAIWNNLANFYGHTGDLTNAFVSYSKAIELNPLEAVYYHNFATTVYLYRRDVMDFYHINEQQVFDKALGLYEKSLRLDPANFPLATDVAQTYYGIRPLRTNAALASWTNTLSLAHDELEREGVHIHLARVKISIGRYEEAQAHLNTVTNGSYADVKQRLIRVLTEKRSGTNGPQPMVLKK